jgi:3-dehydroquinate synthase
MKTKIYTLKYYDPTMGFKKFKFLNFLLYKVLSKKIKIVVGYNILNNLSKMMSSIGPDKILIITDSNVEKLYGEDILKELSKNYKTNLISFPAGEENKKISALNNLLERSIPLTTKHSSIIAFGGGVTTDMVGVLSGLIYRGVNRGVINVPTNVMSQLDSAIGAKTAVNSKYGKNSFGLFNPPEFILVDIKFLKTLSKKEIQNGLSEAVKHAISQDKSFYDYLINVLNPDQNYSKEQLYKIIDWTIRLKLECLKIDPTEGKSGPYMDIGHILGHSIEKSSHYTSNPLTHGEAVALGIMVETYLTYLLGETNLEFINKIKKIYKKLGVPTKIPDGVSADDILRHLNYDNKRRSEGIPYILAKNFDDLIIRFSSNISEKKIREAINYYK